MKYLDSYSGHKSEIEIINSIFKGKEQLFESSINLYGLKKEAILINEMESSIPENLCFNLNFDMAIKQSEITLTNYYKNLSFGRNLVLEYLKSKLTKQDIQLITEAFISFKNKLNENFSDMATSLASSVTGSLTGLNSIEPAATKTGDPLPSFEDAIKIQGVEKSDSGFWSILKGLWNAVTEDGSTIGIIHFILDILGIVGDAVMAGTGIPLGLIADILNGIIYLFRGKYLLATISFIAGVVFGAGDVLKGFKPVAKYADEVFEMTAKGASVGDAAMKVMKEVPEKQAGLLSRFLDYISKSIGPALGKISGMLNTFFGSFLNKIVGWIPLIGKPLKGTFESIAKFFKSYSDDMVKFSNGWLKEGPTIAQSKIKEFIKVSSDAMGTAGAKISKTGDKILVEIPGRGTTSYSAKAIMDSGLLIKRYPKGELATFLKSSDNIPKYFNTLSDINSKFIPEIVGKTIHIGEKPLYLGPRAFTFFTKQIAKIYDGFSGGSFFGSKDKSAVKSDATKEETSTENKANSGVAVSSLMQERMKKDLAKNPGQTYSVPMITDLTDPDNKEAYKAMLAQQNYYAKQFGLPSIIPVSYYMAKQTGEEIPSEAEEFMNSAYSKEELADMKDKMDKGTPLKESRRYVRKYDNF